MFNAIPFYFVVAFNFVKFAFLYSTHSSHCSCFLMLHLLSLLFSTSFVYIDVLYLQNKKIKKTKHLNNNMFYKLKLHKLKANIK